ncbi:molybdopterin-dependent oxidoreductase [Thalassospira xiamenensis]|uniref:molybdopterin-dependent oxidoreductase n=1 Tax=Thalassospira xiamenensis TaxID=220697 RepID=UPI0020001AED|nr:nitrate reductase [Thalassospira xiamenensis]MCK2169039.1 molybdopterin-dependent oxidoreductase [Thalassospira xiamenensis]
MRGEVKTTCPYCGVGCGLIVSPTRDGWAVGGDPDHPANRGRLCSKGAALIDTITAEMKRDFRLLKPEIDGKTVDWPTATQETADRLRATIQKHGPKSVAFYVSGQLLTEDYYIANKLIKGFIGSPNIDTNSRLCMASTVVGHKRAFGADVVPGCYEDLEIADLVVLTGSNLAWCHPVLNQRLRAAREKHGTKIVVIDPRKTASCDIADLHLPIKPGSDVALFNGLLAWLDQNGHCDLQYVARHVSGYESAIAEARADCPDIESTAKKCGLDYPSEISEYADHDGSGLGKLETFFNWFAAFDRTVTVFSQGVNQSSSGSDKVNAIINTHLATGRVGKPGSSPFSVTGQPNAMGGREVGGLANQLAAHMDPNDVNDVDRVRRFWKSDILEPGEGYKAVDMFRAIERGEIKAVWVMATNPAVSLPDADRVRLALSRCPLVIVSDTVNDTDTLRYAHIKLPAAGWAEKSGTVTNSERRISRQRPFRELQGDAKPDWWIMTQIARAMGYGKAFKYRDPADIFAEHAALSEFENDGMRAFDIGQWHKAKKSTYDAMEPFQWPASRKHQPAGGAERLYGNGIFTTSNGRARMLAVAHKLPMSQPGKEFPLIANSGRYRDQWHTMTRTGTAARLSAHRPEPLLEVNILDAKRYKLTDGGLARIRSKRGTALMRVSVSDAQMPGEVFMPMHWNDVYSSAGGIGRLPTAHVDPYSGQPETKHIPVSIEPFEPLWQGLLFSNTPVDLSDLPYWVAATGPGCMIYEIAGDRPCLFKPKLPMAANNIGDENAIEHIIEYNDGKKGVHRYARLNGDRITGALFVGPDRPALGRDWISALLGNDAISGPERNALLAGRMPDAGAINDRLICSCFSVGLAAITRAIHDQNAVSTADIGRLLQAGTGCGSCLPELKEILDDALPRAAE